MQFTTKIFVPSTKKFATYSFTEKVLFISYFLFGLSIILLFTNLRNSSLTTAAFVISCSLLLIGTMGPFFETEPLRGNFTETITITEEGITYQGHFQPFIKIQDFEISMRTFYLQHTRNSKSGPKYFRGINNSLFFIGDHGIVREYFHISSKTEFDLLQNIINKVICEERIPFKYRYLSMVSDTYKTTPEYKNLIQKIKQNPNYARA